jgi:hypothetical protein
MALRCVLPGMAPYRLIRPRERHALDNSIFTLQLNGYIDLFRPHGLANLYVTGANLSFSNFHFLLLERHLGGAAFNLWLRAGCFSGYIAS